MTVGVEKCGLRLTKSFDASGESSSSKLNQITKKSHAQWVESPPKCPKLGKEVAFEIANRNTGFF
jgi:hypothetical protein